MISVFWDSLNTFLILSNFVHYALLISFVQGFCAVIKISRFFHYQTQIYASCILYSQPSSEKMQPPIPFQIWKVSYIFLIYVDMACTHAAEKLSGLTRFFAESSMQVLQNSRITKRSLGS